MASIVRKNNSYCVVYSYLDESGKPRQRWESYKKLADAKQRKSEVEYKDSVGALVIPTCKTFGELLKEYVTIYGRQRWAPSTYEGNMGLINNYILPHLGNMRISDVNTRALDRFYKLLQKTKAVSTNRKTQEGRLVTPGTIRDINKIIRSCFNQAKKWELVERNPAENVTLPEYEPQKREIWTSDVLFRALKVCDDPRLTLALNLAFCCSLRIGEMLGLTWDCVDVSEESIECDSAAVFIKKELQRVKKTTIQEVEKTGIQLEFPSLPTSSTALVLKKPKTASSIRKVFVPKTVAKMLKAWKEDQNEVKELMGDAYHDYGLVFAGPFGLPTEQNTIAKALKKLIVKHGFPPIVFHSFRHASVTYKLKLNGGDIKAVQGDTGHAQSKMVSDVYSHILDEGRKHNAQLFEKAFYSEEAEDNTSPAGGSLDVSALQKLLANPEAAALLAALAKSLK